jgi:hypothetical protein
VTTRGSGADKVMVSAGATELTECAPLNMTSRIIS